ncbi:sulfite exporter TauE/SafE family protein [Hyperthermus butylicus]|uniref:Probable membrane transporter protein n=1 Tax=Hyperthermus butylicus (strain DSM 5456 / JCM 9403 / PLM1-5) TaxID=415426 RepID=A2BNC0_HYPBU|nr:sulfite exporter TauE/SafE family protein [Hyperthermus butylicus]ABM81481.1 universally conserved protein [Hyperthermus butylicus DSM 5456]
MDVAVLAVPLVGVVAGFVGTLLGIGGGAIMVPALVLLGVPVKVAAPASLVAILGTSLGGIRRLFRRGLVDVMLAVFLETASGLGALVGVIAVGRLTEGFLRGLLGIVLIVSGFLLLTTRRKLSSTIEAYRRSIVRLIASWIVALMAGFASATLGIGGGVFKVPVLVFILGLGLKHAVATSKLMVGITAAVGVIGHFIAGRVDFLLALPLLAGTYTGASIGSRILVKLRVKTLQGIAVAYHIAMGLYMLVQAMSKG